MVSIEDLKKIFLLQKLSDKDFEQILPITSLHEFKEEEVVFKEGDKADTFYMLKRGKVLLEVDISELISISLGAVKTGFSFGWSALMPDSVYTNHAICSEPCEVIAVSGKEFLTLLGKNHTVGYHVMEGVAKLIRDRLERRTSQFLMVMKKHPDIQRFL
jgi:CRP-like cAMP-binding protein